MKSVEEKIEELQKQKREVETMQHRTEMECMQLRTSYEHDKRNIPKNKQYKLGKHSLTKLCRNLG